MAVHVIHSLLVVCELDLLVLVCRETHKSVLIQKNSERFATKHQDVKSQIELQSIDEIGVLHVLLHHVRFV
jgi:hypothetical protein